MEIIKADLQSLAKSLMPNWPAHAQFHLLFRTRSWRERLYARGHWSVHHLVGGQEGFRCEIVGIST
jgi:hypothetical protein